MNAQGLDDKEIGQDILTGHKYLTDLYAQGGIESADPTLRQLMVRLHSESASDAGRVFEHMYQRGWYGLRAAEPQDINEMRSNIGQTRQSLAMSAGQIMEQGATAASSSMASGAGTSSQQSQQHFGGISGMIGQGYQQQQPNQQGYGFGPLGQPTYSQYGGGMQQNYGGNLPNWTRQEVPGESGQIASGGPVGFSSYPGGPTTYFSGGPQQGYGGINQGNQQQGLTGYGQYGTQLGSNLPTWTRQEVPGESGQRASGGPVGYTSYPGGPTAYFSGGPQQGYGVSQSSYQPQQNQQLPNWTRQEVGQQGNYGGMLQQQQMGQQQPYRSSYSGYSQLPSWTHQEVQSGYGQQPSGQLAYSGQMGGPSIYQGGQVGTPQQSVYGQSQINQGFNQPQSR